MNARKAASGNIESCKQQLLQNNFLQDDHHGFLEDIEVTLIDKTQTYDPTKRECYWMRTQRTLHPDDLNFESDYCFLSFLYVPLTTIFFRLCSIVGFEVYSWEPDESFFEW